MNGVVLSSQQRGVGDRSALQKDEGRSGKRWDAEKPSDQERLTDEDGVNLRLDPSQPSFLDSIARPPTGGDATLLHRLEMCEQSKNKALTRFNQESDPPAELREQDAEGDGDSIIIAHGSESDLSDVISIPSGEVMGMDRNDPGNKFWDTASACGGKAGSVGSIDESALEELYVTSCEKCCSKIPVLHPTGWFRSIWDWWVISLVLYVAIMVPFAASVVVQIGNWWTCKPTVNEDGTVTDVEGPWSELYMPAGLIALEIFDDYVDYVFMTDLVLNFNTGILDKYGNLITKRRDIAIDYLKGFFFIDFISSIPFDKFIRGDNVGAVSILKCIRLLRLGRLMKKLDQMENANAFRVVKLMGSFTLICHWVACGWFLVGNAGEQPAPTGNDPETLSWIWEIRAAFPQCDSSQYQLSYWYMLSFYWALTTLTTVGYGDITPVNNMEYWFTICVEWAGNVVSAVIVGNVAVLLGSYEASYNRYRDRIETLNAFTQVHEIPNDLNKRLLLSIDYFFQKSQGLDFRGMLSRVSPSLRAEVLMVLYGECISSTNLFEDAPEAVVKAIALKVESVEFYTDDYVVRAGDPGAHLFIVLNGQVNVVPKGKTPKKKNRAVLEAGALFGEMPVFSGKPHLTHIRCTEPTELLLLSKYDLEDLLVDFPEFMGIFRDRVKSKMRYLRNMRTAGQAPPEMLELHGLEAPEFVKPQAFGAAHLSHASAAGTPSAIEAHHDAEDLDMFRAQQSEDPQLQRAGPLLSFVAAEGEGDQTSRSSAPLRSLSSCGRRD